MKLTLREVGILANRAMPEPEPGSKDLNIMTIKERKEFTHLKANLVKRLAREFGGAEQEKTK